MTSPASTSGEDCGHLRRGAAVRPGGLLPQPSLGGLRPDRAGASTTLKARGAVGVLVVWQPLREALTPFAAHGATPELRGDAPERRAGRSFRGADQQRAPFDSLLREAGRTETVTDLIAGLDRGTPRSFDLGLCARASGAEQPAPGSLLGQRGRGILPGRSGVADAGRGGDLRRPPGPHGHRPAGEGRLDLQRRLGRRGRAWRACWRPHGPSPCSRSHRRARSSSSSSPPRSGGCWARSGTPRTRPFRPRGSSPTSTSTAAYPIYPLKDVVALGVDQSSLGADVDRAAKALGLQVSPDPEPDEAYFVRSDNYSFVKQGIPAAQTMSGTAGLTRGAEEGLGRVLGQPLPPAPGRVRARSGLEALRRPHPVQLPARAVGGPVAEAARPGMHDSWFRRFPEPKPAGDLLTLSSVALESGRESAEAVGDRGAAAAVPGATSVRTPSTSTGSPFTTTVAMPSGYRFGRS